TVVLGEGQFGLRVDGVGQLHQVATASGDGVFDAARRGGDGHLGSISLLGWCPFAAAKLRSVTSPDAVARDAAAAIADRTGVERHDVAVVLGSGWAPAAEQFGDP